MSAPALVAAATARGLMLSTAESCTGGLVAAAITEVPGASEVFEQGFVTYSNHAKIEALGVSPATLERHGAVSEPVAAEMAQGALAQAGADIAISVTGIAGPGGSGVKPEGRVCFGLATATQVATETIDFGALGRAAVRRAACDHAIALVLAEIGRS